MYSNWSSSLKPVGCSVSYVSMVSAESSCLPLKGWSFLCNFNHRLEQVIFLETLCGGQRDELSHMFYCFFGLHLQLNFIDFQLNEKITLIQNLDLRLTSNSTSNKKKNCKKVLSDTFTVIGLLIKSLK